MGILTNEYLIQANRTNKHLVCTPKLDHAGPEGVKLFYSTRSILGKARAESKFLPDANAEQTIKKLILWQL